MFQSFQSSRSILLSAVAIFSLAMVSSGYLLGDGLRRAKLADRSVSVRGVSERDVTADLASWTLSFSEEGTDLASVNARISDQSNAVKDFFARHGFKPEEISDSGISVTESYDEDRKEDRVTVNQTIRLRTGKVMKVRDAYEQQADLINLGVPMSGSDVVFTFTGLNNIKTDMIAEANQNARLSAEQFAKDSGASVGRIRSASQGYFELGARDGEGGEGSGSGSPFQKVRVVTNIDYDLS